MLTTDFPIDIGHGVKIAHKSKDGFFIICYPRPDGSRGIIWLPDDFVLGPHPDSAVNDAIELTQAYMEAHPIR